MKEVYAPPIVVADGYILDAVGVRITVGCQVKCISDRKAGRNGTVWVADEWRIVGEIYTVIVVNPKSTNLGVNVERDDGEDHWVNPNNYLVI